MVFGTTILGSNPSAPTSNMLDKIKKLISLISNLNTIKFNNYLRKLQNIKEAKIIFSCLENKDQEIVKFVGGCVRKAINN